MIPAVGYRVWRFEPVSLWTGGQLESAFCQTSWPRREKLEAACKSEPMLPGFRPKPHRADPEMVSPVTGCSCGIYAYHDMASMLREVDKQRLLIGGAVLCWGRIMIHKEGIRAQFVRPLALSVPEAGPANGWTRVHLEELAIGYAIPLLEPEHLIAYASEFGGCYKPEGGFIGVHKPANSSPFLQALRRFLRQLI
jgi:hypothetical protein